MCSSNSSNWIWYSFFSLVFFEDSFLAFFLCLQGWQQHEKISIIFPIQHSIIIMIIKITVAMVVVNIKLIYFLTLLFNSFAKFVKMFSVLISSLFITDRFTPPLSLIVRIFWICLRTSSPSNIWDECSKFKRVPL